ncbi:MAG: NTP transferase domain-containing protein [Candidatus Heimdallarchaeota archaeon]|nr:MAG: NTP transferase domain-containing protein [Candidatus Heimdallarchaeota archaeon]
MKALVLAGGSGKEMLPLSKYSPKTMLTLHGKHLLEYVLDGLLKTGLEEFVIVVGHLGDAIRSFVEDYRQKGISIQIVDQTDRVGIEGAITSAFDHFSKKHPFLLAYGDILAPPWFYQHLMNSYINTAADGAIAVTLVGKSSEFGIASIDDRGFILDILPETPANEIDANYIFAGASILPGEFFEILQEEKKLTAALARLLQEQRRICASVWQDEWVDVGYAWDMLAANHDTFNNLEYSRIHKTAKISPSAHISGLVLIEKNVVIDHNAEIVGPCFIGENSYIGTNSLLREYASIERNCKIGFSVEVKNSVIQPGTKIGRLSFVGDSVVGEKAMLGSGVTTMNVLQNGDPGKRVKTIKGRVYHKMGAVIGPHCEVGSNTVLLPGIVIASDQVIPPGTVIRENFP